MAVMCADGRRRLLAQSVGDAHGEVGREQMLNLIEVGPPECGGLVAGDGSSGLDLAAEHQGHDGCSHVLVDASEPNPLHRQPDLLVHLATQASDDVLIDLEDATGDLSVASVGALDEQDALLLVGDDGSDGDRVHGRQRGHSRPVQSTRTAVASSDVLVRG